MLALTQLFCRGAQRFTEYRSWPGAMVMDMDITMRTTLTMMPWKEKRTK